MTHNFYFGKDADIVVGSASFASIIATDFASLGLTSAQSTAFGLLNTAPAKRIYPPTSRPTRGPISIAAQEPGHREHAGRRNYSRENYLFHQDGG